jgi:hypothetical protein
LLQPAPAEATQEGAIEPIGERSAAATAVREATATEIINNDNPRDTTANGAISGAAPETSALVQATAAKLLVLDSLTDDELLGILASSSSIDDEVEAPEVAVEPPRAPIRRVTRSSTQRPPQISMEEPRLPYDAPIAIIRRYEAARALWYASIPLGSKLKKTNEAYRKAMHLPKKYSKKQMLWCLDHKPMGNFNRSGRRMRAWTDEEKMCYIDFNDKADRDQEAITAARMAKERVEPALRPRRGMRGIWEEVESNADEQKRKQAEEQERKQAEEHGRMQAEWEQAEWEQAEW